MKDSLITANSANAAQGSRRDPSKAVTTPNLIEVKPRRSGLYDPAESSTGGAHPIRAGVGEIGLRLIGDYRRSTVRRVFG